MQLCAQGVPAICALQLPGQRGEADAATEEPGARPGGPPADSLSLVVATAEGLIYQYGIEGLRGAAAPRCSLEGEWSILGPAGS